MRIGFEAEAEEREWVVETGATTRRRQTHSTSNVPKYPFHTLAKKPSLLDMYIWGWVRRHKTVDEGTSEGIAAKKGNKYVGHAHLPCFLGYPSIV